jgi:hypothetical protein
MKLRVKVIANSPKEFSDTIQETERVMRSVTWSSLVYSVILFSKYERKGLNPKSQAPPDTSERRHTHERQDALVMPD